MSARASAYASVRVPCDGGVSPNAYVPAITAEIRVFWPPHTVTREQVVDTIEQAIRELAPQLREKLP